MNGKKIFISILVLLIILAIGYYIYDVTANNTPYSENLFKMAVVVVSLCISVHRVAQTAGGRKPLSFYEKQYWNHIEHVYAREPEARKKLLTAIRFYDESNYEKALSILEKLKAARPSKRDMNALCLICALCYTDWGLVDSAIKEYEYILVSDPDNTTALSNLGLLYSKAGDYENAERTLKHALELDPKDVFACNNLAYMYFRARRLLLAVEYAHKTLEIQPNFCQAASLLAIIYYAADDTDKYDKYRQLAIKCGESAETIEELAAVNYETLRAAFDEQEEYPE